MAKRKEVSVEDVLTIEEMLRKISSVDLDMVQQAERAQLPQMEQLILSLEEGGDIVRKMKDRTGNGRKRSTPKEHHNTRIARRRRKDREYYHSTKKHQRKKALAAQLRTPEGWWAHINKLWRQSKVPVQLTLEEWVSVVWPALDGNVPVITRYNPGLPIQLDNLLIYKSNTRDVLFDGKEYHLRTLGFIL